MNDCDESTKNNGVFQASLTKHRILQALISQAGNYGIQNDHSLRKHLLWW